MAHRSTPCRLLLLGALLLPPLATAAAQAQPAGPGGNTQAATEQHIAAIKAQLRITPAEEAPWDDFAGVMRSNAAELGAKLADRTQHVPTMNAVDDLRSYAEVTGLRAQEATRLVGPFEALYGTLSPTQKQAADAMFQHPGAAIRRGSVRP